MLVLWTGYRAGVQAVRSLTRAGFEVVGAHPEGADGGSSRLCRHPLTYPPLRAGAGPFLARLTDLCEERSLPAHAVVVR